MLEAEAADRQHAIIEPVIAELKHGALSHLPSVLRRQQRVAAPGRDRVQSHARLRLPRLGLHSKAETATIRTKLITVTARIALLARRTTLRLPTNWPWRPALQAMFTGMTRRCKSRLSGQIVSVGSTLPSRSVSIVLAVLTNRASASGLRSLSQAKRSEVMVH
jgi:hypothetical protein